ncbi:hypothetical protein Q3P06_25155 [Ralstonia pseudosolanacearum]|uniref:hypothetical protein n=1 Tax=Ralstonia pseudosolanacearum TaxID=1310165 RepID=UPI0026753D91|nr:hypothetical protein [Ralstonia pseudosolanacearum]MDO3515177.1 hypothetical protein [Ralstonia pseudosolanacearum]MDO3634015.1 hypothetical protein [Ralstonia pseudosolanacearum]
MLHPDVSAHLLMSLRTGLRKRQFVATCRLYRWWLNRAQPGEVEALIARCPGELHNHLRVLLRDVLMHFPRAVFGIPCLMQHRWSDDLEAGLFPPEHIVLPQVTGDTAEPVPGLAFIGWSHPGSPFTSAGGKPILDAVAVQPGRAIGVIALFKASDESLVYDETACLTEEGPWLSLPDFWWGHLMAGIPGQLIMQAYRLMPYPEAVEAARFMCDAAGVMPFNVESPNFVRQLDIEQVKDRGRQFIHLLART